MPNFNVGRPGQLGLHAIDLADQPPPSFNIEYIGIDLAPGPGDRELVRSQEL